MNFFSKISSEALYAFFVSVNVHLALGKNPTTAMFENINQIKNRKLKRVLNDIRTEMFTKGTPFSDAFELYGKGFPPEILASLRVGETTGAMPSILQSCESILKLRYESEKSAKTELIYPLLLISLIFALTVIAVLMLFPIIFSALPHGNDFSNEGLFRNALEIALIAFSVIALLFIFYKLFEPFGCFVDFLKIHIPIIGKLERARVTSICALCLEKMMSNGVSGLIIYDMLILVAPNKWVKENLRESYQSLLEGISIDICLQTTKGFTELFYTVPIIGRTVSGEGRNPMGVCAELAKTEMISQMKVLVSLVQPVMFLLIAGVLIGGVCFFAGKYLLHINEIIDLT